MTCTPRLIVCSIVFVTAVASGAFAQPITCGATLGPGGLYVLQADLTCPFVLGVDVRLTLIDGAVLGLNGHTMRLGGAVRLRGTGTVLRQGRLGASTFVWATEGGQHTLADLEVLPGGDYVGIFLDSDENHVHDCHIIADHGVAISGDGNRVVRTTVEHAQEAYVVGGHGNTLFESRRERVGGRHPCVRDRESPRRQYGPGLLHRGVG